MQVESIGSQSFRARLLVKTPEMKGYMEYLRKYKNAPKEYYNSKKDLLLTKQIMFAIKNHPSKEDIVPGVTYRPGNMFSARGTISTNKAHFIDSEPARSDSIAPIKNILRRILDPQNKTSFNKLVGEEYSAEYESWWKQYIAPHWNEIKKNFREETYFVGNYDEQFNENFNRQENKFWKTLQDWLE